MTEFSYPKTLWGVVAAVLALQLVGLDASAAQKRQQKAHRRAAAPGGTSSLNSQDVQPSALDKIGVVYYGNFYGPSITEFDSNFPDDTGAPSEPIYLYSSSKLIYKFTPALSVNLNPRWVVRPDPQKQDGFQMLDPRVGFKASNAIDQNGFSITPSIDLEFALTESTQGAGRSVSPRLVLENAYAIPNSRWTLGSDIWARYFIHNRRKQGADGDIATYFSFYSKYQFTPALAARLLYEAEAAVKDGAASSANQLTYASPNIQPAILWNITEAIEFAPYLLMYTSSGIKSEATAVGFEFTAAIL